MQETIEIINELEKTSSTNAKIDLLKNNKHNETLKLVLYYTYSDNLMYGLSESKLRELLTDTSIKTQESTWASGFDMLDKLACSNINDALRTNVKTFLLSQSEEVRELFIKILTKDLRCNISSKTINKAIPKLIVEWNVQQAYSIDKVKLKKDEWIALSLKLNGIRSTLMDNDFRSRQNKIMNGFEHIKQDIKSIEMLEGFVVDGEMVRKNVDNLPDNENFRLTASIVNSDSSNKEEIGLVIFDIMPKEEFVKGESLKGFKDRLGVLNHIRDCIELKGLKNISVADTYYTGTDHSQISILLDKVDSEGAEGLMLLRDMPYKTKRHNGILKCKKFKTSDCYIIGYEEGEGRLKGLLGSFTIAYKGNNVKVGSGYSDEQRREFWDNRDSYIERVLEVKFKEESMDSKTGLISLQFPTFVCIRELGKEISYN